MTNKYLEKIATMIAIKGPPRSEKAVKRPKKIRPPKLKKFHVTFDRPRSK